MRDVVVTVLEVLAVVCCALGSGLLVAAWAGAGMVGAGVGLVSAAFVLLGGAWLAARS